MTRAPCAFLALAFSVGIGFFWWLTPAAWQLWGSLVFLGWVFLCQAKRSARSNLLLILLVANLGAVRAFQDLKIPACSIARTLNASPRPITCEGILVGDLKWIRSLHGPAYRQGWVNLMRVCSSEGWVPAYGKLLVRFPAFGEEWGYGDRLLLSGAIRNGDNKWLWLRRAAGRLTVSDPQGARFIPSSPDLWARYRRWVAVFRGRLEEEGRDFLGPVEAGYLEALLLGEGEGIPQELEEAFRKTGTIHVLVVSGLQVGLIGGICLILLSILRVPRSTRYLLCALALFLYCVLTGASPPILRATITGILLFLGFMRGGESSPLNGLGWAALLILLIDPRALADASFQLSFAAVAGLLLLTPAMARWLTGMSDLPLWKGFAQAAAASCGAWMAVAPLVVWYFHLVTPMALVANLIVVPWASCLTACGFLLYAAAWLHGGAALAVAAAFTALCAGLTSVVEYLARVPCGSWTL